MTTDIEFPQFNEARGETASMQLVPPFQFTGVTMRVFPLRANRYLVQRFIDNQLNIIPPAAGQFRVFLPYIYLIVVNYGKMAVTAANLGWISQNEVAFSIPMIWQHEVAGKLVQDFAFVSPFIYVDNPLSMTTGREVYGWPKGMAGFDPQLSAWMSNPMHRTQQTAMSVDVVREAYAGGRSQRATLLEIDSAPFPAFGQFPPDVRNPLLPWNAARKSVYSASALTGDSFEILRGMVEAFSGPGERRATLDQWQRLARNPGDLAVLNTVNLKQFRDADQPSDFAYQALTNTPMTIRSFRRGGMLGDARIMAGDIAGGYMVRVHEYDTQPIVSMLGLEVASTSEIEGVAVANLAPVFPFWLEVDLDYPLASVLAWRQKGGPGWVHGEAVTPTPPGDTLYNTTSGAITQEVAGPFEYPNATVRVMPLAADRGALQAFLDAYLNATLAGTGERFEAWGDYVYMIVLSDDDTFSLSNDIGDLASRGASFEIPVKRYREGRLIGTALVPAYVYANSANAAMSERGVNGIPAMTATLTSPANSWLDPRGPSPEADDCLMTIRGDVLPVVGQGQQAKTRTIVECDTREPVGYDDAEGWQRLAGNWVPPIKAELERKRAVEPEQLERLKALALELLANQTPLERITLKQFRSAVDPRLACYQALVAVPLQIQRLFEIEEIESELHVRVHEYPSQAIVGTLGLVVKAWERGAGCQVAVLEPLRPFWLRAQLREELGRNLYVWRPKADAEGKHWQRGVEGPTLLDGSALDTTLVGIIEDGEPRNLADHVRPWASSGALGMDREVITAAIECVEPQIAIESILSCEWEAWHDPRWVRGRELISEDIESVIEGAFPSEVTHKTAEALERMHETLGDPSRRREWDFQVHRLRPVDTELREYRELANRLARVQEAEEELRSLEVLDRDGDGKPDLGKKSKTLTKARERLENASGELFSHMLSLREQVVANEGGASLPVVEILQEAFVGVADQIGRNLDDIGDDTRAEIVRDFRRAMASLRERIIFKLSKSWQKPDHCVRRQTVLKVTNDFFPHPLSYDQHWYAGVPALQRARRAARVSAQVVARSTRLLGIAPNHELVVHEPGEASFWRSMPGSGSVSDVTVAPDGRVFGIGLDDFIWMRADLQAPWLQVPASNSVKGLTFGPDGLLLGIGMNGELYMRERLERPWLHVPDSGKVMGVCALPDGRLVGAGAAGELCVRERAELGPWHPIDHSQRITKIAALPSGELIAVGADQQLYARSSLQGSDWELVTGSGPVIAIALLE